MHSKRPIKYIWKTKEVHKYQSLPLIPVSNYACSNSGKVTQEPFLCEGCMFSVWLNMALGHSGKSDIENTENYSTCFILKNPKDLHFSKSISSVSVIFFFFFFHWAVSGNKDMFCGFWNFSLGRTFCFSSNKNRECINKQKSWSFSRKS